MLQTARFLDLMYDRDFRLWAGVPCSFLKPVINRLTHDVDWRVIGAANEGDAVALATGATLAGLPSVAFMQNSGLTNAISPLTSLNEPFQIPVLLVITWRGQPDAPPDEPQHHQMGRITTQLLDLLDIPHRTLPAEDGAVEHALDEAVATMRDRRCPYALIVRKGAFCPEMAPEVPAAPRGPAPIESLGNPGALPSRQAVLRALQDATAQRSAVVATTGFTGRELYAERDLPNQLYMVGSMGCASTFGLGLAVARPAQHVVVVDGDGAVLMRMGALATIGHVAPPNFLHVVLDNRAYESTGNQPTVSDTADLAAVAAACGYARVLRCDDPEALAQLAASPPTECTFVHSRIRSGVRGDLPRPSITPREVAQRLGAWLARESER